MNISCLDTTKLKYVILQIIIALAHQNLDGISLYVRLIYTLMKFNAFTSKLITLTVKSFISTDNYTEMKNYLIS